MYNSESLMHRMTKYSHHKRLHPLGLMHSLTPDVDIAEINKDYFSIYICKKNMGGWRRLALLSTNGVAPSRTVGVFASVNLPLHHKVQKLSSDTDSLG